MFDSFFLANLHAAIRLAKSKGAAVLRAPRVQALLSAMAQPDTAALIAHALVALAARESSNNGAEQTWQFRPVVTVLVPYMRATLALQAIRICCFGPCYKHITLFAKSSFRLNLLRLRRSHSLMCIIAELAVEVLCNCYMHQHPHALTACAVLLRPDSNQPLPVRIAAVRGEKQLPHMPVAWCAQPLHVHSRQMHVRPHSKCIYMEKKGMQSITCMLGHQTWSRTAQACGAWQYST